MTPTNRHHLPIALLIGAAALLGPAGCSSAEDGGRESHARFGSRAQSGPALPRVAEATARLDGRTLTVEAVIETRCKNDEAALTGGGGFGVTGRTYLIEAQVTPKAICMTAIDRQDVSFEIELAPAQPVDDVMIRLEHEMTLVPLEIVQ